MKTDISFNQDRRTKPRTSDNPSDWLVELQSLQHPEITVIEVVTASCFDEAVFNAFFTRNIASSWKVTEVEEA